MSAILERHRFNVDEYFRMAEVGILDPQSRVELIDGEILDMAPIGINHRTLGNLMAEVFTLRLARKAIIQSQYPVRLSDLAAPQPDIAVLRRREDFYADTDIQPSDVFWLVEIADSSLLFDRGDKLRLYARSGIAEVWIVNLQQRQLELYSKPDGETYGESRIVMPGQSFNGAAMPEEHWAMAELLGWDA
jgi:Uma2 family endonuclease